MDDLGGEISLASVDEPLSFVVEYEKLASKSQLLVPSVLIGM